MPSGVRWWNERAREFVAAKRGISEGWRRTMGTILGETPRLFERAGSANPPLSPADVSREDVERLRASHLWSQNTRSMYLTCIRQFLRASGNPISEESDLWQLPGGESLRRRWLSPDQLGRLYTASEGRERLLVALEGFNGLRRVEVLRLHVRDLDLTLPNPVMRVLGKGRHGGKWRTIPVQSVAYAVLVEWVAGKQLSDALYPWHQRTADHDIRAAGYRAGLGIAISGHDLRRSFGRIGYYAGVSLVNLKHLYGHESVDMTAHYIGLDADEMAKGLTAFGERMAPFLTVGA